MRARRTALACMAALVALAVAPPSATAAGRRPYGGAIDLPVHDFTGLGDPHLVATRSGRLVATLVHGHLFRVVGDDLLPDLAADAGTWANGALTVALEPGARFTDGRAVTAADVKASLERLAALGAKSPIGELAQALTVSEVGPRTVAIAARSGAVADELRALLARPEAAILARGQLGVGCGAFKPANAGTGDRKTLVAWEGFAGGRPWIQEVRLVLVAKSREEAAFRFGEIEVAFEPLRMTPAGTRWVRGGWTTWFAVFHPRFRASSGAPFRAWVRDATLDARLGRYVDGRSQPGATPWPDPSPALVSPRAGGRLVVPREHIVVAFTEGESDSAELARAVRDVLRPAARSEARVLPVPGLDVAAATRASDPPWDVALVRWDWAAITRAQGAHELAWALGLAGPGASAVLSRATDRWANGIVARADALAFVHAERPASLHATIHGVAPSGPLPYLIDAWSAN